MQKLTKTNRTRPFVFCIFTTVVNVPYTEDGSDLAGPRSIKGMADVDVLIVGGGICGVLAGRRFAQEGLSYKIIERNGDYGGVWAYRANDYSHLQVE